MRKKYGSVCPTISIVFLVVKLLVFFVDENEDVLLEHNAIFFVDENEDVLLEYFKSL